MLMAMSLGIPRLSQLIRFARASSLVELANRRKARCLSFGVEVQRNADGETHPGSLCDRPVEAVLPTR